MNPVDRLAKQLDNSPPDLLKKLGDVLGVRGKTDILELVKADPEARRLVQKIMRSVSPPGSEPVITPADRPRAASRANGVEF